MTARRTSWRVRPRAWTACALLGGAGPVLAAQTPCADLAGVVIPASGIGLPTNGASVQSARVNPGWPAGVDWDGMYSGPMPEFCRVIGTIAPLDSSAPPIRFRVNLPAEWNGKAVQYGGGGFNGELVGGLASPADAPRGMPVPLAQGYATIGTDAGHQNDDSHETHSFARNDEALVNFAYASYKKVRDVADALIRQRYGRGPKRLYYVGGSEGGREGLAMAQRFPADYDGVISTVPAINWTALLQAQSRTGVAQQDGGWLNPAQVALLDRAVLKKCDSLDGLSDGVVSNYLACRSGFQVESLACPAGTDPGDLCLSDRQIAAVRQLHSPYEFSFALANGVRAYPGYGYGNEAQDGGFGPEVSGEQPATFPVPPDSRQGTQWVFGGGVVRHFIMRDSSANPLTYSPDAYAERVQRISELMDATNPDLAAFAAHGGKLIMKENMSDYLVSPYVGTEYYESVVKHMGQPAVDRFVRLYVTPGVPHNGRGVSGTTGAPIPAFVDLLGVLDAWADLGRPAPRSLVQISAVSTTPPYTLVASRPMCSYPEYPRYRGSGDVRLAASFECAGR
jgi:pimeloyl-ACP methyl ester carboxylesterase